MSLVNPPEMNEVKAIETLAEFLISSGKNAKDQIETLKELCEFEYIPESTYKRMVRNEFVGILKDLRTYIDIYMPYQ